MNRRSAWWRWLGWLMVLPACVPVFPSGVVRQTVNDRLRGACPGQTDPDIEATIVSVETDLARGVTKQREIELVTDDCTARGGDIDATDACITCAIIVVDEVYGP